MSNLKRWLCQENLVCCPLAEIINPQRDIVNAIVEEFGGSDTNKGY